MKTQFLKAAGVIQATLKGIAAKEDEKQQTENLARSVTELKDLYWRVIKEKVPL